MPDNYVLQLEIEAEKIDPIRSRDDLYDVFRTIAFFTSKEITNEELVDLFKRALEDPKPVAQYHWKPTG